MRTLKADHVGDQSVSIVQAVIEAGVDIGLAVPAKGLLGFLDEGIRQLTLSFGALDQFQRARGEDAALVQDPFGQLAQYSVLDQLQGRQRGEG